MGGVKYQKIFGGYDGGVEAGFEGSWGKATFANLCERLAVAKQAADDGNEENSYVFFWWSSLEGFGKRCKFRWYCT
jgi:hypothetical protein